MHQVFDPLSELSKKIDAEASDRQGKVYSI